ncbi:MAG: beta strand repeat-containing protein, partial [Candidatus Scalindua sp.]
FEGTTANTYEIALTGANPGADVTVTIPASTGTLYISGGTDVAVADGGTGASNASGAKTNLGFMTDVVDDASPKLGGNLDVNGKNITSTARLDIVTGTNAGNDFRVNTTKLVVEGDTGNVGIGTSTPDARLHVQGSESVDHGLDAGIEIKNTASGGGEWYLRVGASGTATPAGGFSIGDPSAYRMVIDSSGNIGIGPTVPAAKLEVGVGGNDNVPGILINNNNTTNDTEGLQIDMAEGGGAPLLLSPLSAAPTTTDEGSMYYDSDDDNLYVYSNGGWVDLTDSGGDITTVGDGSTGSVFTADGTGNTLYFEGTNANTSEIALTGADPGADVTVTIPASTGTLYITGGTDVAVADGGTGASNASGAKTNLGFITDVVDDTTPQLGGDLDVNGKNITSTAGLDIAIGASAGNDFTVDTSKLVVEGDTGNVGIGTTSPNDTLEVTGNIIIRDAQNNGALIISPSIGEYGSDPEFVIQSLESDLGGDAPFGIMRNALYQTSDNTYQYIDNAGDEASVLRFENSGDLVYGYAASGTGTVTFTNIFFIDGSEGSVGIGDSSPDGKLEVRQTAAADIFNLYDNTTNVFTVLDGGNVGIGGTSPGTLLQLKGASAYMTLQNSTAENTDGGAETRIIFEDHANAALAQIQGSHDGTADDTKGDLIFSTHTGSALTEAMRIDSAGDVGIGTATPGGILHINGTTPIVRIYDSTLANGSLSTFRIGKADASNEAWGIEYKQDATASLVSMHFYGDTFGSSLVLKKGGNVGIGTASPIQAKLVVNGSVATSDFSYGYLNNSGNTGTNSSGDPNPYSIYASDRIAASEFNAFSDARIKDIIDVSDSALDLETLQSIEITNYTFRDPRKGDTKYKKVIGQQLAKVYPRAVTIHTGVIADIMRDAEVHDNVITLANHGLSAGERVNLVFEDGNIEGVHEVLSVTADTFTVDAHKQGGVYVYGREVDDFHYVDYAALTTLGISAIQELDKKIDDVIRAGQAKILEEMTRMSFETVETAENLQMQVIVLNDKVKELSAGSDAKDADIDALMAGNAKLEERLARLEQLL